MLEDLVCIKNRQNCSKFNHYLKYHDNFGWEFSGKPYWGPMVTCIEYFLDIYF